MPIITPIVGIISISSGFAGPVLVIRHPHGARIARFQGLPEEQHLSAPQLNPVASSKTVHHINLEPRQVEIMNLYELMACDGYLRTPYHPRFQAERQLGQCAVTKFGEGIM